MMNEVAQWLLLILLSVEMVRNSMRWWMLRDSLKEADDE